MESTDFDILTAYASSGKVPPVAVHHEAKWERYQRELAPLGLPSLGLSRFLEITCAPPCSPSTEPLAGWKLLLPCLKEPADFDLPFTCWNEVERTLRRSEVRPRLLAGLAELKRCCPEKVAAWLRLSPHNLCRLARRLGVFSPDRVDKIMRKLALHAAWSGLGSQERWHEQLQHWAPLTPAEWLVKGSDPEALSPGERQEFAAEFQRRQPLLQLDLFYRLLRS